MNKFIDRHTELEILSDLYKTGKSEFVVIYGRRRLGKTSLIKEFTKGKKHCYFLADKAGEKLQINSLASVMATSMSENLLENIELSSWYDLFELFDRVRNKKEKFIFVIDEFQYLCQTQSAFSSYIQKWWDEHWKSDNIMLILCGSVTSMMYRETMEYNAPLYGRASAHILLSPFKAEYLKEFYSSATDSNTLVEFYSLSGGVPRYIELFEKYTNYRDAVISLILNKNSILYSEAKYLLQEEVTSPNTCWSILNAIANGSTKISELGNKLGLPANQLTRYIELLKDLFLVHREVPVLEKNPMKSKKGVYAVSDPYIRLWFGCVYPYESFLEFGEKEKILDKLFPLLHTHTAYCFEVLARDYVKRHFEKYDCIKVGRQWSGNYEIDVAGVNAANKLVVLGECKWTNAKIGVSIYNELKEKARVNKLPLANNHKYIFFSKNGYTEELIKLSEKDETIFLVSDVFGA